MTASIEELIERNFSKEEKIVLQFIFSTLEVLEHRIEAIDRRLPSRVEKVDTLSIGEGIVVVDFWAEWCVPCYYLMPPLETVSREFEDVKFYRVDVEKHQDLLDRFKIQTIPVIAVFKDGKEITRMVGVPRRGKLEDRIRWMIWRAKVPEKEWEKTRKMVESIARTKGWKLNPDKELREALISALTYNRLNYGRPYCPCKPEKVDQNVCPCRPYKDYPGSEERIKEKGVCYCGLFVK